MSMLLITCTILLVVKDTEARAIDYGAVEQGGNPRCSHEHPELCKMEPANKYAK